MYKTIIFPIDVNSKHAWDKSFAAVIELVRASNAKLYLMTVIPNYGMNLVHQYFPKGWLEEMIKKVNVELNNIATKHLPDDIKIDYIVERGPIYQCIVDKAAELDADLIVMAAHRPELKDYLLGPNAAKVVRHAKTSVLIVRS
ncbi:Universal stress protein F [Rickettsiales bacterium Ac37b]|nr:Universal stress protein F [Rickettsiales bacterium Ac37b]